MLRPRMSPEHVGVPSEFFRHPSNCSYTFVILVRGEQAGACRQSRCCRPICPQPGLAIQCQRCPAGRAIALVYSRPNRLLQDELPCSLGLEPRDHPANNTDHEWHHRIVRTRFIVGQSSARASACKSPEEEPTNDSLPPRARRSVWKTLANLSRGLTSDGGLAPCWQWPSSRVLELSGLHDCGLAIQVPTSP